MIKLIKRLFCKHDDELVIEIHKYESLKGDMIYKRCKKCGRIKKNMDIIQQKNKNIYGGNNNE